MFDIGFSEIFVIAVVALLVLGPERLPKAARFAGLWVRRARAQWYSVKTEFERELADDELKRSLLDARDNLRDAGQSLREGGEALRRDLESSTGDVRRSLSGMAASADRDEAPSGADDDGQGVPRDEGTDAHGDVAPDVTADPPAPDAPRHPEDTHASRS